MARASAKKNTGTIVRAKVRDLLTRSPAFHQLPPDQRKQLAHNMVKVVRYLAEPVAGRKPANSDSLVSDVDFPDFVARLVQGVFQAPVDASAQQMKVYAELVKDVAKSVNAFSDKNISDSQARDWLTERYPHFFRPIRRGQRLRVRLQTSRQQLLANMILMGINRIVVTNRRI